jgi:hypothetical protein
VEGLIQTSRSLCWLLKTNQKIDKGLKIFFFGNNKMETQENTPARNKKHLRYYDRHKDEILAKCKERYEKNKEVMKKRVLDRYYKKKEEKNIPAESSE